MNSKKKYIMAFNTTNENPVTDTSSWIPEGYVVIMAPDNQHYVVPEFFVLALHQKFDGYWKKEKLEVFSAARSVSRIFSLTARHANKNLGRL